MRTVLLFLIFILCSQYTYSQEKALTSIDSLYKEDQFYFGVTYNVLDNMPKGMSQNGFSSGFHIGSIKDIPINKNRNWALGIGLGYSTNSINQNLFITKSQGGDYSYELLDNSQFTKNKFSRHLIEIPFELRWRTSTANTYKFWRVYTGFKLGYVFASTAKLRSSTINVKHTSIDDFDPLQYGFTLSIGYNTWNAYLYYALTPIFKNEAILNGEPIDIREIKIGLIFYIL